MTQIDFYILADTTPMAGPMFACKLVDKAYHLKHSIYVHTANQPQAQQMDELLWTFNPGSFLPHEVNASDKDFEERIQINRTNISRDELINLVVELKPTFELIPGLNTFEITTALAFVERSVPA